MDLNGRRYERCARFSPIFGSSSPLLQPEFPIFLSKSPSLSLSSSRGALQIDTPIIHADTRERYNRTRLATGVPSPFRILFDAERRPCLSLASFATLFKDSPQKSVPVTSIGSVERWETRRPALFARKSATPSFPCLSNGSPAIFRVEPLFTGMLRVNNFDRSTFPVPLSATRESPAEIAARGKDRTRD